jgi:hypothetical protein
MSEGVIKLSIQNGGIRVYRFYIPSKESRFVFKKRKQKVLIKVRNKVFLTHTTCGPKDWTNLKAGSKKGYDLYSKNISDWIIKSGLYKKIDGRCRNLNFRWKRKDDLIILTNT